MTELLKQGADHAHGRRFDEAHRHFEAALEIAPGDGAEPGLLFRQPRRAPWLDIRACALVAKPGSRTLRFARLPKGYIECFMERGAPERHPDQCALHRTWRGLDRLGHAPAVRSIFEVANQTVFRVGHSYDGRMADPRHAQFTS